jgi:hypothetical protein
MGNNGSKFVKKIVSPFSNTIDSTGSDHTQSVVKSNSPVIVISRKGLVCLRFYLMDFYVLVFFHTSCLYFTKGVHCVKKFDIDMYFVIWIGLL